MNKLSKIVTKYQKIILSFFFILTCIMTFCVTKVKINYNMQDYLPEQANSTKAISVMKESFNDSISNASVMLSNVKVDEAVEYVNKISKIEGVVNVSWINSMIDVETLNKITLPNGEFATDYLDDKTKSSLEGYYKNKNALLNITIESGKEQKTVNEIYDLIGEENALIGTSVNQAISQNIALTQSLKAIMLIAPLIILILMLATTSWIEPFIYLTTIGIAVLINLGLNVFRGSISYVTLAVAPLLQLAVSLDYAVFLQRSFDKYRTQKIDAKSAMKLAMKDSLKSISASCLTTLFGFIALLFMNFKIGPDMGISLVIGVLLSFIAVLTFLPALILCTYQLNDKCKHKPFLPNFKHLSNGIVNLRIPCLIVIIGVMSISVMVQKNTSYMYGSGDAGSGTRLARDTKMIENVFGKSNMVAILVPVGDSESETKLVSDFEKLSYVTNIISYASTVGYSVPENMVPDESRKTFHSNKYSRIILSTTLDEEGKDAFKSIEEIKKIISKYYNLKDIYMCGNTVNMYDMKTTIENDQRVVSIITVISIFIILLLEFKSLILPIILILGVKGSIWITLAISGMSGGSINYLGYLVVSTVMMGATIDYAILITDNYIKLRKEKVKIDAMKETLSSSIKSILVSASTLAFAGFALGLTSSENVVKSLGLMLGFGTTISFVISITFLPALLLLLDSVIPKLSLKMKFIDKK